MAEVWGGVYGGGFGLWRVIAWGEFESGEKE